MKSKPANRRIGFFAATIVFSATALADDHTIYFHDTFNAPDGAVNTSLGSPRQTGTFFETGGPLENGGAYYFHTNNPATGRPLPAISGNQLVFDGTTGVDATSTLNLDGPGYLLRTAETYDHDADPETPEIPVLGTPGAALNFGPELIGTHYTVKATVNVTGTQNVDKLGIVWTTNANPVSQNTHAGSRITVLSENALQSVRIGVNAPVATVNTYLDATPIPANTTHEIAIDVDETQSTPVYTIYINGKAAQTGTLTFNNNNRFLVLWGDGNVFGNTTATIDDIIVEQSQFVAPTPPIVWKGTESDQWDLDTTANWDADGSPVTYSDGDKVIFDATANVFEVDLAGTVEPELIQFQGAQNYRFFTTADPAGSIAGATPIQKSGIGNLRLETSNSYTGGTTVTGGSITVTTNGALGTNNISLNANTLNFESPATPLNYSNTISGLSNPLFGKLVLLNPDDFDADADPGTELTLSGSADNNVTQATVNEYTRLILAKTSSATVNAVGLNDPTIDSLIIREGGTVQLAGTGGNQIEDAGTVLNDGTLDLNGLNEAFAQLKGSGIVTNSLAETEPELTLISATNYTWSGSIQDGAGKVKFRKNGAANLTIDTAQSFTGGLTVGGGTLTLTGDGSVNNTAQVNLQTSASAMDVSGATGGLALTSPTSLINGLGTFTGNVSTPGKIAPGIAVTPTTTLTFNGNLTVSGSYEINVDDRNSSPVTATADATLDAGVITAISVTDGGQVYTAVPTVTITGDGTGATATAVIAGGVVTAVNITNGGTGYTTATVTIAAPTTKPPNDQVAVDGDLDITGAALIVLPAVAPSAFPYTIATYTGTRTGTFASVTPGYAADYSVPGEIRLVVAPVGGYSTWAATNAGNGAPDEDFDNDGIPNGVEYFMGETGSTFTSNPQPVSNVVTWPKDPTATDATGVIETSINLVDWTPAVGVVDNGTSLQYTITGPDKQFTRLKVTIP
jgi:autotransporter-associated beta strand protein